MVVRYRGEDGQELTVIYTHLSVGVEARRDSQIPQTACSVNPQGDPASRAPAANV